MDQTPTQGMPPPPPAPPTPAGWSAQTTPPPQPQPQPGSVPPKKKKSGKRKWIVGGVVVVLALGAIGSLGKPSDPGVASATPTPAVAEATTTPTRTPGVAPSLAPSEVPVVEATEVPVVEATEVPVVEPTPEPTPEATENPFAFKPVTLKGRKSKVVRFKIPESVPALATFVEKGSSNFIVYSIAADGSENDLLVNEIGNYKGTVMFDTDADEHSVAFKVRSNGTWTITVKPVTSAKKWDAASVAKGSSANVLWVTGDVSGFYAAKFTHRGGGNFIVYAWTPDDAELLVNEIGRYTGETLLPDGTILIEVKADGTWTITPTS